MIILKKNKQHKTKIFKQENQRPKFTINLNPESEAAIPVTLEITQSKNENSFNRF